jgi:hypothetical protein
MKAAFAELPASLTFNRTWTKDSARVIADTLDALGRAEEAKALRERYGVISLRSPSPLSQAWKSDATAKR